MDDIRNGYSEEEIEMYYALACDAEREERESLSTAIVMGVLGVGLRPSS